MSLSNTLFLLLSLFLLMMLANSRPDVTSFQIDTFKQPSDELTYERDAFVPGGLGNLNLIATNPSNGLPRSSSVGRVLYTKPVNFWERGRQSSFKTTIKFHIPPFNNPANGQLTFFIRPVNSILSTGGTGQNLGLYDALTLKYFEMEYGVHANGGIRFNSITIKINSETKNVTRFGGAEGHVVTVRINYSATTRKTDVVATYASSNESVSCVYDLKNILSQQVQVGIRASSTGQNVVNFKVLSWHFTLIPDKTNEEDDAYIEKYAA